MQKTLYDLQTYILDASDVQGDPIERRRALRAAIAAATDVMQKHQWKQYTVERSARLNAPVSVEVSIDDEGEVDLGTGAFPTWAAEGSIVLGHAAYPVSAILGSNTIAITGWSGGDIMDVDALLVHNRVMIDHQVRSIGRIRAHGSCIDLEQVSLSKMAAYQRDEGGVVSSPQRFAVEQDRQAAGTAEIVLSPSPGHPMEIELKYFRMPILPSLSHPIGVVSFGSSNGAAIADIENPLPLRSDVRGVVLAISEFVEEPDGELGSDVDGNMIDINEVIEIASMVSRRRLRLRKNPATVSGSGGVGGVVTHVLDLPDFAWQAVTLFADAHFMRIGRGESGTYWQTIRAAEASLDVARSQEATTANPPGAPVEDLVSYDCSYDCTERRNHGR